MVCHRVRSSAFNWILALIASAQTAKSPCIRSTFAPHCGRKGPTGFSKRAPTEKNAENPFWACSPASNHFIYSGSRMVRLDQHEHAGAGAVRRCDQPITFTLYHHVPCHSFSFSTIYYLDFCHIIILKLRPGPRNSGQLLG